MKDQPDKKTIIRVIFIVTSVVITILLAAFFAAYKEEIEEYYKKNNVTTTTNSTNNPGEPKEIVINGQTIEEFGNDMLKLKIAAAPNGYIYKGYVFKSDPCDLVTQKTVVTNDNGTLIEIQIEINSTEEKANLCDQAASFTEISGGVEGATSDARFLINLNGTKYSL